ncbi:MAG: helix-turn-helix domain-containing protein [Bacteroidales bacterium]|nr:helix-turn-helix domain-containing protein [Bacteroidales bacterium]
MKQILTDKILLLGAFMAFFLAALLVRKKEKRISDLIIGTWLIFLGIYVAFYSFTPPGFFNRRPWLINLYIALLMLNGPFLYEYAKSLINPGYHLEISIVRHFLPFILFIVFLLFLFPTEDFLKYLMNESEKAEAGFSLLYLILPAFVAVSVPVYIFKSVTLLARHSKVVTDNFSSAEKRNLIWLRNLIVILGIVWILLVTIFFIHHILLLFSDEFCINGLFLTLSVFIILTGYYGLNQPAIFTSEIILADSTRIEKKQSYSGTPIKEEDLRKYLGDLDDYMATKKPYLDNQLTLYQLAGASGIPPHVLSRIINEHHGKNFFDFINNYRVEEFKKRLSDTESGKYTLLAIAFDCGFNSKSSFNRFFRKNTGKSPSEYKISLSSNS